MFDNIIYWLYIEKDGKLLREEKDDTRTKQQLLFMSCLNQSTTPHTPSYSLH